VKHVEVRRVLHKAPRGLVDHMVVLFAERLARSRSPQPPRRSVVYENIGPSMPRPTNAGAEQSALGCHVHMVVACSQFGSPAMPLVRRSIHIQAFRQECRFVVGRPRQLTRASHK
jgi:hypothetical protein